MDDQQMITVYEWIDSVPLSRDKKNIARDFCDGLLVAEIVKHFKPKMVELHNYPSASSSKQKLSNWNTLRVKVFKKLKMTITQEEIDDVINCKNGAIEKILFRLYNVLVKHDLSFAKSKNEGMVLLEGNNEIKIREEIEKVDKGIESLREKKETLERKIKETEEENKALERKYQELRGRLEYGMAQS